MLHRSVIALAFVICASQLSLAAPDAKKILEASDRARGGASNGIKWELDLNSVEGSKTSHFVYDVKVLGTNVLSNCKEPARCKGEIYLFIDRNLWVFRSGLRKPLALSQRQRLSGQASNGDIAATNYARDYTAKVLGEENINGQKTWKLNLKAKGNDLTYDQVNYWVSQKDMIALKAEFLTLEGQPFKVADFEYNNTIKVGNSNVPFVSKMTIKDAKNPALISTLTYSKPVAEKLSPQLFNVNKLAE